MTKISAEMLKNEFRGWKKWEIAWLFGACAIIVALSLYWNDTWLGIVSATTGTACVICTGKGKLSAYLFGLINCVLYAYISYQTKLYGETMLNLLYYLPMQFVGFYTWSAHMNEETKEVVKKRMTLSGRLLLTASVLLGTAAYGFLLKRLGDPMPFVDAFTTVASVAAMIVSVRMFAEQWWIWIIVDVFTIYMWLTAFLQGQENIATLIMWTLYLANAVIMLIKWEKEAQKNAVRPAGPEETAAAPQSGAEGAKPVKEAEKESPAPEQSEPKGSAPEQQPTAEGPAQAEGAVKSAGEGGN